MSAPTSAPMKRAETVVIVLACGGRNRCSAVSDMTTPGTKLKDAATRYPHVHNATRIVRKV